MATVVFLESTLTGAQSWATAANWSTGTVPVTGDNVYLIAGSADISSGLAQSGVTLASLTIASTFSGTLGTSTTPLSIGATVWNVDASNAGRINLDFGTTAFTGTLLNGGTSGTDDGLGLEPARIKGTNASNVLFVLGGTLGIATNSITDTATMPAISVLGDSTVVNSAAGVTLTSITQEAGTITTNSALPTLNQDGGVLTTQGSGAVGANAINIGGTVYSNSTGAIGNGTSGINVRGTGTLDFSTNPAARSITGVVYLSYGATFTANRLWVTNSSGFKTVGCKLENVTVDIGSDRTLICS